MRIEDIIHKIYGKIKVLHIDDDELQLSILKENLMNINSDILIDSENSLEKALDKIKINHYDCILMDLIMPDIGGIEASNRVTDYSNTPIIIYTLKESEYLSENDFYSNISDFVTKKADINHYRALNRKIEDLSIKYRTNKIYEEIVLSNNDILLIIDKNGNIVFHNEKFQQLTRHQISQSLNIVNYIDEESRNDFLFFLRQNEKEIQTVMKDVDGRPLFVQLEKFDFGFNSDYRFLRIKDITKIIIENNIDDKGQEKFLAFANISPDAIMLANIYGYVTYINPAYTRLTGYTKEEIIGKHALQLQVLQGRDIQPYWNLIKQVISGKTDTMSTEFGYQRKDGTSGVGDVFIGHYKSGKKRELIAIVRDITHIKKKEEEFQNIFNSSPEGIIHTDLDGNIKNINESAKKILKISNSDLDGQNILDIKEVEFTTNQNLDDVYKNIIAGNKIMPFEIVLKNGSVIEINASLIQVVNENLGIQISIRDVTKQKQYTSELEQLVQERTNQIIDNERMVTLAKYSSMITHDLKGPLQVISNSLYLMRSKPENSDKYIKYIYDAVNQANSLLSEMNQQSKIGDYNYEMINLKDLIEESLLLVKANEKIILENSITSDVYIKLDKSKFERVITNLLKNAIEAIPEEGNISISLQKNDSDVSIIIQDTGIGMSEEQLNTLFKPFQTTKNKGMGIGLTFCKNVVEAHGGEILVRSTLGEGTMFTIKLPLSNA